MGLVVSAYGPLLEHLTRRFGVSLPVAGATISVHFAGGLVGVLIAMRSMERLPARVTVMAGSGIASLGCAAVAIAFIWPFFLAAIFVIGLGFGALVLALNQLVAYSEGRRRAALLSALNSAYSAGAVAGPVLVVVFARDHFSLFFLAAAAVALALIPGAVGILGRLPTASGSPSRPGLLVFVFIVAFTLYVGVETGTGGWMPSHLESAGLRSQEAATATSGFFLAIVTGRLLMTLMPARVPEHVIVIAGAGLGAVALLAASIGPLAPWAYIAAGLALAPIFPTGIVWLAKLRPGDSRATSWLFPAASVGGIAGPGAIGLVIAGFGVGWTPVVLALVGGSEVKDASRAARVTAPAAKHLASLIRADEDELVRRRDVEELAIHLLVRDHDGLRQPRGDGMSRVHRPDHLALASRIGPPAQRAAGAHEAPEDLGVMARVQDHDAHAVEDARVHAFDDRVVDLVVGGVAPPGEHVGLRQRLFGQAVLWLVERGDANRDVAAQLPTDPIRDRAVHAFGIDALDQFFAPLVDVLVPDGDAERPAGRRQIAAAAPVVFPVG